MKRVPKLYTWFGAVYFDKGLYGLKFVGYRLDGRKACELYLHPN